MVDVPTFGATFATQQNDSSAILHKTQSVFNQTKQHENWQPLNCICGYFEGQPVY